MKVELYSFPECQSRDPALENLKRSLRAEGLPEDIDQVSVDVAATAVMRFLGSPTIRIDGVDVEGFEADQRGYSYSCRTYEDGGETKGWPSVDKIRQALQRARSKWSIAEESGSGQ